MYSLEQRKTLLKVTDARRREVIERVTDYMARTGLNQRDMASRIRYSHPTFNLFLNQKYHVISANDSAIVAAVVDYMDRNPIQPDTEITGKIYETENVAMIRQCFNQALEQAGSWDAQGFYFHGAPGSQKSFVLKNLIAQLNLAEISKNGHGRRAFYVYCSEGIRPTQLMKKVAEKAGSITAGDTQRILRNLRHDLRGRKALFIFDEAQHLDIPCIETVREIMDEPPHCGLLFAGSHQLKDTFNRLTMEQCHSRMQQGEDLPGIQEDEARMIIAGELGSVPEKKISYLIKEAEAIDLRKGRNVTYISARRLFRSIRGIKNDPRSKGAKA